MTPIEVPSRQEMFNRAWNGLKAQNWEKAVDHNGNCVYEAPDGKRCAWGHVDPEARGVGSVYGLRYDYAGLAVRLSSEDLAFADKLQVAHDRADVDGNGTVERRMRNVALLYGLTIPEEDTLLIKTDGSCVPVPPYPVFPS